MLAKVFSAAVLGVEAFEVEVEVNTAPGKTAVVVVGLPDASVKESRDRVMTAVMNSGYRWNFGRTTINLGPADVRKEGPSFDLPIAVAQVAAEEEIALPAAADCYLIGELALDGGVRPVRGALPVALEAARRGKRRVFVPADNAGEAAFVQGVDVYGVRTLRETFEFLRGGPDAPKLSPVREDADRYLAARRQEHDADFSEVKGQHHARRAMEIAAAGAHNVLLLGPPGSGKSMMAKRLPGIMPPLTLAEALETTKIHSIAGLLGGKGGLVCVPPYFAPHASISDAGLLGGSNQLTPGEISLCHHGVLFLDELPEFKRSALESLRQPLEDGQITISRVAGTVTFPASFVLVGAMNPCPCGYHGSLQRQCRCNPLQVARYREKISGPLLDRIDLHVEVSAIKYEHLSDQAPAEASDAIRERVVTARRVQRKRAGKPNARLTPRQIRAHCRLDDPGTEMLRMATSELHLSARAYDRVLKVARTVADLEGSADVQAHHLGEAIGYRTLDRGG